MKNDLGRFISLKPGLMNKLFSKKPSYSKYFYIGSIFARDCSKKDIHYGRKSIADSLWKEAQEQLVAESWLHGTAIYFKWTNREYTLKPYQPSEQEIFVRYEKLVDSEINKIKTNFEKRINDLANDIKKTKKVL